MKQGLFILLLSFNMVALAQPVIILKENNVENAYPRLSKDRKQILYQSNRTGKWQLYTCDIFGKNSKRITKDNYNNNFPDWTPDNEWIAFVSDRDGNEEIYVSKANGTAVTRITQHPARDIHPYFSPDGKYILFNSDRESNQFDVYRYSLETRKTERITNTPDNETCARYAPDMKSMVLLKNNDISDDIYILRPGSVAVNLSKTPDVYHGWPVFSNDGKWIYYSSMEGGTYSIYRIKPDGSGKQQLTHAKRGEDNARVNVANNGRFMIYNIKSGSTISIVRDALNS